MYPWGLAGEADKEPNTYPLGLREPARSWLQTFVLLLAFVALIATSCGSGADSAAIPFVDSPSAPVPTATAADTDKDPASKPTRDSVTSTTPAETTPLTLPTPNTTTSPTTLPAVAAPNGRVAPRVAATAAGLADQVAEAERGLLAEGSTPDELAAWGHVHQVAIRKLGYEPDWDIEFFEALPAEFQARTLLHVSARRSLIDLSSGYDAADFIPAWEIINPEPADALLSYYHQAEAATGIEWEYLAAINLVETGMGRIRGLSSAGAQGPMQFLPTTWAEAGIGEGDINNPSDAINGAARYLIRRGGPSDMAGAIWGYNNSDDYVSAVRAYAELLRQDPAAYAAIYNWEIYFFTEAGDVWLPAGFRTDEVIDLSDFLADNPWSAPDPGLR